MIKKFLLSSLLLFSAHAFACGGDPILGQFECNTDSIRVTYGITELQNNKWINPSASPSDTFVSGPPLNLYPGIGEFKSIQVTGVVKIHPILFQQGSLAYSCQTAGHVFDIVLTALDASNNTIILSNYPVSITNTAYNSSQSLSFCYLNGGGDLLSIPFIFDINPNKYKNFQIKFQNLTLNGLGDEAPWIIYEIKDMSSLLRDNSWYLQLVGIR